MSVNQYYTGNAARVAGNLPTSKTLSAATNATPIVVTTTTNHGLQTNEIITITDVTGNTAANGTFIVGSITPTTATLLVYPTGANTTGSGAYTGGPGTLKSLGFGTPYPRPRDATDGLRAATVGVPLEALGDFTAYLMYIERAQAFAGTGISDTQEFASSGTWTKPSWVIVTSMADVEVIGGGGGGGSGPRQPSGASSGGGGGAGGGITRRRCKVSDLGSTETITIGVGGTAGAAVTADNTNGNNGGLGGTSSIGTKFQAKGGTGGGAGVGGADSNPSTEGHADFPGDAGALGRNDAAGDDAGINAVGAPGGGAGGGMSSGPTGHSGGTGGLNAGSPGTAAAGGAFGGNPGTAGGSSTTHGPGGGGGGGGGNASGVGGTGGAGGTYGAGGGGGGAAINTHNSGAGGVGADGFVRITVYL